MGSATETRECSNRICPGESGVTRNELVPVVRERSLQERSSSVVEEFIVLSTVNYFGGNF